MSQINQFDHYLTDSGPAALVVKEHLLPVEGADAVLFPATFAAGDGFEGGYNIDRDARGGNVALIDSVGSQANRMEPLFTEPSYANLVPQVVITAGKKSVNLLNAGHRAGDAIIRCSTLQSELRSAFEKLLDGDASPLAKIAPTSLVFGVWDSRDTQAKTPRLIASTVRAYNVRELKRSAQFNPALDYASAGLEEPSDLRDAKGRVNGKHPFAQRGFTHVPATASHGGVIADGGIRRDATLALAALRLLPAGNDPKAKLSLQRYILGLALVAFTRLPSGYLRQGTILVLDPEKPREFVEVFPNGKRAPVTVTHEEAVKYATVAAKEFGVGKDQTVPFDKKMAEEDLRPKKEKGKKDKAAGN